MTFRSVIERLRNCGWSPQRANASKEALTRRYRAGVERLEDRLAPAVINWDAGGDNVNWCDRFNWTGDQVPTSGDDAIIGETFQQPGKNINCPMVVRSIDTFASITITSQGVFNLRTTTVIGRGQAQLINQGLIHAGFHSRLDIPLTNQEQIRIEYSCENTSLTATRGLTNAANGTISLKGCIRTASLVVAPGPLNNQAGGLITTDVNSTFITVAQLNNTGTIATWGDLTVTLLPNAVEAHRNAGTIINYRGLMNFVQQTSPVRFLNDRAGTLAASGSHIRFTNTGTAPQVENQGKFVAAAGWYIDIVNGQLTNQQGNTLRGGTYEIAGVLRYPNANIVNLAADVTIIRSSSSVIGTIVNSGGANALANFTTIDAGGAFRTRGAFTPAYTVGNFTNNGTLDVGPGSTFQINGTFINYNGLLRTLTGGKYLVEGTFKFNNASIARIAPGPIDSPTWIEIIGAGRIIDQATPTPNNALGALTRNEGTLKFRNSGSFTFPAPCSDRTNSGIMVIENGYRVTWCGLFTNLGTVRLHNNGVLASTSGDFRNGNTTTNGTVNLTVGGFLALAGNYVQERGTTTLSDGYLYAPNRNVELLAGVLTGSGVVFGNLLNAGSVYVGGLDQIGYLLVYGSYTQRAAGTLYIDLSGIEPAVDYDFLYIEGTATLDGTLVLNRLNNYRPRADDIFFFLWATQGITGNFSQILGLEIDPTMQFYAFHDGNIYYLYAYLL